jgi:hypothetical protein
VGIKIWTGAGVKTVKISRQRDKNKEGNGSLEREPYLERERRAGKRESAGVRGTPFSL